MITANSISKFYGNHPVFREICLTIETSSLTGIIGPSGGGKSTLIRCLAGMTPIDAGTIDVLGTRIIPKSDPQSPALSSLRQQVGLVFQHLNLWPYRTALDNIVEGLIFVKGMRRPEAVALARGWADKLEIAGLLHRYPGELSGGQRQRVALARALVMNPKFVLLDEITSALDPVLIGSVLDAILILRNQGLGVILISHQIEFVRRYADMVYFLSNGKILESGPAATVLAAPSTAELSHFIQSVRHGW